MCALIGIVGAQDAVAHVIEGLHMQQHRGTEAAGVAVSDGTEIKLYGGAGTVDSVFPYGSNFLDALPGDLAIGHTRYSTVEKDENITRQFQPIAGLRKSGTFCVAHNGNLTNVRALDRLIPEERIKTRIDSERIVRLLEVFDSGDIEKDLMKVLPLLNGSYELLVMLADEVIAVRDPQSVRPLSLGVRPADNALVIASETCALDTLDATWIVDIDPGTFVRMSRDGWNVVRYAKAREKKCIFELAYFSGPASKVFGVPVYPWRVKIGEAMEEAIPAPADIVVSVPDSANGFADGYARSGRSGVLVRGIFRNHNMNRTFIAPRQDEREVAVRRKFVMAPDALRGKRVALIDDSLVRGTTMRRLVQRVRNAGASEVHVRSAFDTIRHPCRYGIDTRKYEELLATGATIDQMCRMIGADTLAFFDLGSMLSLAGGSRESWCTACVTGEYWHEEAA